MVAPQDLDGNPSLPEEHILGQVLVVPQINSAPEEKVTAGYSCSQGVCINLKVTPVLASRVAPQRTITVVAVFIFAYLSLRDHVLLWATTVAALFYLDSHFCWTPCEKTTLLTKTPNIFSKKKNA